MYDDREKTDPGLMAHPVTYGYCKSNTSKIMAALRSIEKKTDTHIAVHEGQDQQKQRSMQSGQFWIRFVLALVTLFAVVGGVAWTVSSVTQTAVERAIKGE